MPVPWEIWSLFLITGTRATSLASRPRFAALTNRVAGSLLIAAGIRTAAIRRA